MYVHTMNKTLDTAPYDKLFAEVSSLLKSGRPGDYQHIKSVYAKLVDGYRRKLFTFRPRIMLPAAILHDVGFGFLKQKHMRYFTGGKRVLPMRDAIDILTRAYTEHLLPLHGFRQSEITAMIYVMQHGDQEKIRVRRRPIELVLLHDLNLYDRFLPHRRKIAERTRSRDEFRIILKESYKHILLPQLKQEAKKILETY